MNDYVNGYIERKKDGTYAGKVNIDGVLIPNVQGVYFTEQGKTYLWLRRAKVLEYNDMEGKYIERDAKPSFEAYLEKNASDGAVAFKGAFSFLRFRYSAIGVWDKVLGMDKQHRLNIFIERLPMAEQTIINGINQRRHDGQGDYRIS